MASVKDFRQLLHDRHRAHLPVAGAPEPETLRVLNLKRFAPSVAVVNALVQGLQGNFPEVTGETLPAASADASSRSQAQQKKVTIPKTFLAGVTALNLASAFFSAEASAALVEGLRTNFLITTINLTSAQFESSTDADHDVDLPSRAMGYAARNELLRFEREGVTENVRSLNSRSLKDVGTTVVANFLSSAADGDGVPSLGGGHGEVRAVHGEPIAQALSAPTYLIHLGLAKNGIGENGMRVLRGALLSSAPRVRQLERLEVYCNVSSPQWGTRFAELIISLGCTIVAPRCFCGPCFRLHGCWHELTASTLQCVRMLREFYRLDRIFCRGNPKTPCDSLRN